MKFKNLPIERQSQIKAEILNLIKKGLGVDEAIDKWQTEDKRRLGILALFKQLIISDLPDAFKAEKEKEIESVYYQTRLESGMKIYRLLTHEQCLVDGKLFTILKGETVNVDWMDTNIAAAFFQGRAVYLTTQNLELSK